jgi:hypothetical protein
MTFLGMPTTLSALLKVPGTTELIDRWILFNLFLSEWSLVQGIPITNRSFKFCFNNHFFIKDVWSLIAIVKHFFLHYS